MGVTLLRLSTAALLPVLFAALFYLAEKKTAFGKLPYMARQAIIGAVFGGIAVLATEYGVQIEGAIINVRSAAPLTAALVFGGPAGIIAGIIGGAERWFATLWGAGAYSRLACTIATVFAGFFGAGCRKHLFDDKKGSWLAGFAIGLTTEVMHMLLIFLTNMRDVARAFTVVTNCAVPMIVSNSVSVALALLVVALLSGERIVNKNTVRQISHMFQLVLLVCITAAFIITSLFSYTIQTRISDTDADELLRLNIKDVKADINDASDKNLLELTRLIVRQTSLESDSAALAALAAQYDVAEINIVDDSGIITASTIKRFVGFDMSSGAQSREFLALLYGVDTFVQSYQTIAYDRAISRKYAGAAFEDGGFVQVGYDAAQFHEDIAEQVSGAAKNRHVGQNGSIIICDESFTVVSDPGGREGVNLAEEGGWDLPSLEPDSRFTAAVNGVECYCLYSDTEGYNIVASIPVSEAMLSRDIAVYVLAFMEILVFAALFINIYFLIKRLVVDNIHRVNASLAEITSGNLSVRVDVRSNEEFASLSDDINATVTTLKRYIAEAAARIDRELEFAREIQRSALPSVFPPYPQRTNFDIFASMDPAKEVGGDFYDFYMLGDDTLVFLVADVSGKGIPAAMFMMTAKTLLKGLAESGMSVDEVFTKANDELCANNAAGMFVTAWMGALDLRTGVLSYVNAGHNPPLVRRKNGAFEYLRTHPNLILAGMEGIVYKKHELTLAPGDDIFLYTDGVTEATDADEKLYGEERLLAALAHAGTDKADILCERVSYDIAAFVGGAPQFDDITMLYVRLNNLQDGDAITTFPEIASLKGVLSFLESRAERFGLPKKTALKACVAADEIYSNIVNYSGATETRLLCRADNGALALTFTDNGKPFDPTAAADPDTTLALEERREGGLGILMVKKSTRSMSYEYSGGFNSLTVCFDAPETAEEA